ncbi:MAG: aminotransferase class III-fold pyridoxal phosphate-dependent enzyme, partial [Armatimonadetes bacterium]|nr:aminotransferase class III-fold pyridoxal phosphate-dependent enzyme [Armatimonadota bacterium]
MKGTEGVGHDRGRPLGREIRVTGALMRHVWIRYRRQRIVRWGLFEPRGEDIVVEIAGRVRRRVLLTALPRLGAAAPLLPETVLTQLVPPFVGGLVQPGNGRSPTSRYLTMFCHPAVVPCRAGSGRTPAELTFGSGPGRTGQPAWPRLGAEHMPTHDYARSVALWNRAKMRVPGASQTMSKRIEPELLGKYPAFIERGAGCRVWDVDGNEYVDFLQGMGPVILGYAYPAVDAAIRKQLASGILFGLPHAIEVDAAEAFCTMVPGADCVR